MYKRQTFGHASQTTGQLSDDFFFPGADLVNVSFRFAENDAVFGPVSYTHLDVYKRQGAHFVDQHIGFQLEAGQQFVGLVVTHLSLIHISFSFCGSIDDVLRKRDALK